MNKTNEKAKIAVLVKPMSIRIVDTSGGTIAIMQGDECDGNIDLQWAKKIVEAVNLHDSYEELEQVARAIACHSIEDAKRLDAVLESLSKLKQENP